MRLRSWSKDAIKWSNQIVWPINWLAQSNAPTKPAVPNQIAKNNSAGSYASRPAICRSLAEAVEFTEGKGMIFGFI